MRQLCCLSVRKGFSVDNDVSVTWLPDEDSDDRVPPGPGSRLRVLAVMGAVVVGCGVAAIVVSADADDEQSERADQHSRVVVVNPDPPSWEPLPHTGLPTGTGEVSHDVPVTEQTTDTTSSAEDGGDSEVPPETSESPADGIDPVDPGESDTGTPPTSVSTPSPSAPSPPSAPPESPTSTAPPGEDDGEDDEDDEEDEDCPWWWPGCW